MSGPGGFAITPYVNVVVPWRGGRINIEMVRRTPVLQQPLSSPCEFVLPEFYGAWVDSFASPVRGIRGGCGPRRAAGLGFRGRRRRDVLEAHGHGISSCGKQLGARGSLRWPWERLRDLDASLGNSGVRRLLYRLYGRSGFPQRGEEFWQPGSADG